MGITGRPKSQNPKANAVTLRITDGEKKALEERYGTARNGLRAALNALLGRTTAGKRTEPQAPRGPEVTAVIIDEHEQMPEFIATPPEGKVVAVEASTNIAKHFHKPSQKDGRIRFEGGVGYQDWLCECGEKITRRTGR